MMGNNPVLFSDVLGDTTRIYDTYGTLLRTYDDNFSDNQEHFFNPGEYERFVGLYQKHINKEGKFDENFEAGVFRTLSKFYIGNNTRNGLKELAIAGEAEGYEQYAVLTISNTKELEVINLSSRIPTTNIYGNKYGSNIQEDGTRSPAGVKLSVGNAQGFLHEFKNIATDAHTHGLYSIKTENSGKRANLLIASGSDEGGSTLQNYSADYGQQFNFSIIATTKGYNIYSIFDFQREYEERLYNFKGQYKGTPVNKKPGTYEQKN